MTTTLRTLPASWFRSKAIYELEQRAVFEKAWYLLGPVTKFAAHVTAEYDFAGIKLVVEREDGELRVKELPDREGVPFKITASGLVFAATTRNTPFFEDFFVGLEDLLDRVDFTKLPYRRTISYEGRFNWKTMQAIPYIVMKGIKQRRKPSVQSNTNTTGSGPRVDGYQECLHCRYTHRAFSAMYPPDPYEVRNHGHYSQHVADPARADDGLFLYFFPSCTLNVYGGGMTSFRVCPTADPGVTRMEFDYYHERDGAVAVEDYDLCETAQRNLEAGVYSQGVLNAEKENGVSHYQWLVRERVVRQFEEDMRACEGREGQEGPHLGAEKPQVMGLGA